MDLSDLSALLGEDLTAQSNADIWVVVPDLSATALVGEARRLADSLGCYVQAVLTDEAIANKVIAYGADKVHVVSDALACLMAEHPEFVFLPVSQNTAAAQLAQHFRAGLITDARQVRIEDGTRALLAAHPVYGGDYLHDLAITSPVKLVTLDARFLDVPYADASRSGETIILEDAEVIQPVVASPIDYTPQPWLPLHKARRIVSIGRGLKAEHLDLAKQLAAKLGAELGGDKSAFDSGWIDDAHEVGITGADVAPELYVALGVRGDTYHNYGITRAKHIIAVHPDASAPIFAVADEGIVADPKEFLNALLAQL